MNTGLMLGMLAALAVPFFAMMCFFAVSDNA